MRRQATAASVFIFISNPEASAIGHVKRSLSQAPNSAVQVDGDSHAMRVRRGRQCSRDTRTTTIDLAAHNVARLLRDRHIRSLLPRRNLKSGTRTNQSACKKAGRKSGLLRTLSALFLSSLNGDSLLRADRPQARDYSVASKVG